MTETSALKIFFLKPNFVQKVQNLLKNGVFDVVFCRNFEDFRPWKMAPETEHHYRCGEE